MTQFADYLATLSPEELAGVGDDAGDAVEDPTAVERGHVELFVGWMIETRSASSAVNKFKCLQQFFRYLVNEDEMPRSPLDRMPQPTTPKKLVPVLDDDLTARLFATCDGKSFSDRRDTAI